MPFTDSPIMTMANLVQILDRERKMRCGYAPWMLMVGSLDKMSH
jgi:dihydroorotase-like cyclic amidohydrolase